MLESAERLLSHPLSNKISFCTRRVIAKVIRFTNLPHYKQTRHKANTLQRMMTYALLSDIVDHVAQMPV